MAEKRCPLPLNGIGVVTLSRGLCQFLLPASQYIKPNRHPSLYHSLTMTLQGIPDHLQQQVAVLPLEFSVHFVACCCPALPLALQLSCHPSFHWYKMFASDCAITATNLYRFDKQGGSFYQFMELNNPLPYRKSRCICIETNRQINPGT
jgi:hypothetical protein